MTVKFISLLYKLYLPLSSNNDNNVGQQSTINKVAGKDENINQQTRLLVKKKTSTNKQGCWQRRNTKQQTMLLGMKKHQATNRVVGEETTKLMGK